MSDIEADILARVNKIVEPYGCVATDLGPYAVGVKGDNREYGPSVFITFREDMTPSEIQAISTEVTNRVAEISRVLMNIIPHTFTKQS